MPGGGCRGENGHSAHRLNEGLVLKAPVAKRRDADCVESRSWRASPYRPANRSPRQNEPGFCIAGGELYPYNPLEGGIGISDNR